MSLKTDLEQAWEAVVSEDRYAHPEELEDYDDSGVNIVEQKLIDDSGRWYNLYRLIFRRNDEYVAATYKDGATEYQDYDARDRDVDFEEVVPKEVTVTKYVRKPKE